MTDKILSMIGMAKRAGRVLAGEFVCGRAIKNKSARLIIIADDASCNTKKSIRNSCAYYKIPYIEFSRKEELGKYTGSDSRAVISINDDNFAKAILDKFNQSFREEKKG